MQSNGSKIGILKIIKIVLPSILMMIFLSLYTMLDGAFVSRFVNTDALSAINIVYPYVNFILGISIMLGTGGCALIMKKMGEAKEEEAKSDFSLLILFSFSIGLIISILSLFSIEKIIKFLGSTDILYKYCKDYLFYMIVFTIPLILKTIFEQFLIAINKSKMALLLTIMGGVLNLILDYVFIVILDFGVKGAAIATGIGYFIPSFISVFLFVSKKNMLHYKKPSKSLSVILKSCYNGSSEMISQLSSGIITFLFNMFMLKFLGENGVASITIVLYINFFVISAFLGYSIGISPKISFFYGSNDENMLKQIIRASIKLILIFSLVTYAFILIFSPFIISFFSEKGSDVYDITLKGIKIFSFSFLLSGINIFLSGMFTAFSNGKVSAIISFLRAFVFEAIGIIFLSQIFNIVGIWLSVPFAQLLGFLVSMYFYKKYKVIYKY